MFNVMPNQQNKYPQGSLKQRRPMPQAGQPMAQPMGGLPQGQMASGGQYANQQMQNQQLQASQTSAFPQQQGAIPVDNPAMNAQTANPHQAFIQEALKQGYSPDMVMHFLSGKLNLK